MPRRYQFPATDTGPKRPPCTPLALRPVDAARALGVSPRTFHTWMKSGRIPCVRVGRCTLVPVAALSAWLAEHAGATPAGSARSAGGIEVAR